MKTKDSNYQSIKRSMVAIEEFIVADGGVVLDHFLHTFVGFHARLRPGQVEILEQREDVLSLGQKWSGISLGGTDRVIYPGGSIALTKENCLSMEFIKQHP